MSTNAHRERLMQVLLGPHVSEKSTAAAGGTTNQIVFKVRMDATKMDIRQAVELLFEVKVDRVAVIRMPAKVKRFGTNRGRRSAWKKAYVRLAPGHDINFIGAE
jgi:large subunit ribosomal protein L23